DSWNPGWRGGGPATELAGGNSRTPRWPGGPPTPQRGPRPWRPGRPRWVPPLLQRVLSGRGWRMDPELQPDLVSRAADQHMVGTRRERPRVGQVGVVDGGGEGARLVSV